MKPIIGVTCDSIDPLRIVAGAFYSKLPFYALRSPYINAISKMGGIPLILPCEKEHVETYASLLKGLVISGGGFDINPQLYGQTIIHETVQLNEERTDFELELARCMLSLDKPILGICGGMQLINVILGGTLIQDIPSSISTPINHVQSQDRTLAQHALEIMPTSKLFYIGGLKTTRVNSVHHQAVLNIAPNLSINAHAEDGIIEGIESTVHRFCLGVQWHPEFFSSPIDEPIWRSFIHESKR